MMRKRLTALVGRRPLGGGGASPPAADADSETSGGGSEGGGSDGGSEGGMDGDRLNHIPMPPPPNNDLSVSGEDSDAVDDDEAFNPMLPPNNFSDTEDDSDSDSSGSLGEELPPGFVAFLSTQQNKLHDELSAISDRLRGNDVWNEGRAPLRTIRFVRENVQDSGAFQIARAMEGGCSSFRNHKEQNENGGVSTCTAPVPRRLPSQCPTHHIREIIFSRCHIGDRGACALARALSTSCAPSLRTLDLSSNHLSGVGVTCLAGCLVTPELDVNGGMDTLVLSSNPIGSEGSLALARALRGHRLECVDYASCLATLSAGNISGEAPNGSATGYCCLKRLHVSGCQLNDDDAAVLGNVLLPHCSYTGPVTIKDVGGESNDDPNVPSLSKSNNLMHLNLHRNCITTSGMEHLYSVIMRLGADPAGQTDLNSMQSLFCKSNHVIDIGVVVDYGTRDHNYGTFFDQEEDEELLAYLKEYEMTRADPNDCIDEQRMLMKQKLLLKEKVTRALQINRECAVMLEQAAASAKDIIFASARKKIALLIGEKLRSPTAGTLTLPRRQDEYGKYLNNDFLGINQVQRAGPTPPTVGKLFSGIEANVFPRVFSWVNRQLCPQTSLAVIFDILCENPDVCSFQSATVSKGTA